MNEYSMEELIPVVVELSEKYTSKESTSISYQKAQQLMEAVIYCIEELDMSKIPERELYYVKRVEGDAIEAYREGYQLVIKKVIKVKEIYEKVIEQFQSYQNQCLEETVLKGIPGFLRYYDAKFAPQDHILTFDYPTLIDPLKQCGVDAVYSYISYIAIEQEFLHALSNDYVRDILENYQNDYETLFFNISSVVMRNMIGAMIVKKPLSKVKFQDGDYQIVSSWVVQQKEHLEESLTELLRILIQKGYPGGQEIFDYLKNDIDDFSIELRNACKHDCLSHVIG